MERKQSSTSTPILVSACLLGIPCRYDGKTRNTAITLQELKSSILIPVCAEVLGGLPTPRPPSILKGGDGVAVLQGRAQVVGRDDGANRTEYFIAGAQRVVEIAHEYAATKAILKSRSPSCGVSSCTIDGNLTEGMGVTAAALYAEGLDLEERNG